MHKIYNIVSALYHSSLAWGHIPYFGIVVQPGRWFDKGDRLALIEDLRLR